MAGAPGFEPGIMIPKTNALPLGYAPIYSYCDESLFFVKDYWVYLSNMKTLAESFLQVSILFLPIYYTYI